MQILRTSSDFFSDGLFYLLTQKYNCCTSLALSFVSKIQIKYV